VKQKLANRNWCIILLWHVEDQVQNQIA